MRSGQRPWWLVPIAVYVASVAVFATWAPLNLTGFPVDDAWIHRVYARAFAYGHGFAYNAGEQTTGFTSPLWVVITAPAHWLEPLGTTSVVVGVKLIGAVLGALTVGAAYRIATHASQSTWPAVIAASAVACQPALAFSALAGMESVLLLALWCWLIVCVQERRFKHGAILLGLLPVARPEGIVFAGLVVIAVAIIHRHELRTALRTRGALIRVLWMVVPTLAWIVYCQIVSGHPLPATYYLKARGAMSGEALAPLWTLLTEHGLARSVPLVVVGAAALCWCGRTRPALALLGGGSLIFVTAILVTRTFSLSGYYWTRWTDPGVLGFTTACFIALAIAASALVQSTITARVRWASLGAVALVVVVAIPGFVTSLGERAARLASDTSVIERMNVAPGRWIAEHVPEEAVLGVHDAGALRYFGRRMTIDVVGLNNVDVAFKRVPIETILGRLDWLAAYPAYANLLAPVARFKAVATFQVPLSEYSICDCPGQTLLAISRRADAFLATEQRDILIAELRAAGPATAWLAASSQDAASIADAAELRGVFEAAGWNVAAIAQVGFRLRPGLSLLAADEPAAPSAEAVRRGLDRAKVSVSFAADYRGHLARNPSTMKIDLAHDQAFVLVVGPRGP